MESGGETQETTALRQEIERALRRAFDPADVLPRLARLSRLAPPASDDGVFAHRQLAEILVERHPWRAALYARKALAYRQDDDRAWAVLAFCQTLLGNFRSSVAAYMQALACSPANPWYAHNLGHLLDVAVGAPERALPWLKSAYAAKPDNAEIVASYAHALARAGRTEQARTVVLRALERFESHELEAILRWLEQGAPARRSASDASADAKSGKNGQPGKNAGKNTAAERPRTERAPRHLARLLEQGLSHLPLDSNQRKRALVLARDALPTPAPSPPASGRSVCERERVREPGSRRARAQRDDVAGLAAAVAYAIVYIDHVPLSQAEVAAPFRVGVGRLRGRFAELRAKLDLIRGDARYATTRR